LRGDIDREHADRGGAVGCAFRERRRVIDRMGHAAEQPTFVVDRDEDDGGRRPGPAPHVRKFSLVRRFVDVAVERRVRLDGQCPERVVLAGLDRPDHHRART
jgi:hypothetical protein